MSTLVFAACVLLGAVSWRLAAFVFMRARGDYRGPPRRASWMSPFVLWDPANYNGLGALRIRRSWIWLLVFMACTFIAVVVAPSTGQGQLG